MPCLFFRNVPDNVKWAPYEVVGLRLSVAKAAGCRPLDVEIHIEDTQYKLLKDDGKLYYGHGVHVFVERHGGRSDEVKGQIAKAIYEFLAFHFLGKGSDITFRDSPAGTFYFEGERVPGGLPRT